jgi:hypothetical protein
MRKPSLTKGMKKELRELEAAGAVVGHGVEGGELVIYLEGGECRRWRLPLRRPRRLKLSVGTWEMSEVGLIDEGVERDGVLRTVVYTRRGPVYAEGEDARRALDYLHYEWEPEYGAGWLYEALTRR